MIVLCFQPFTWLDGIQNTTSYTTLKKVTISSYSTAHLKAQYCVVILTHMWVCATTLCRVNLPLFMCKTIKHIMSTSLNQLVYVFLCLFLVFAVGQEERMLFDDNITIDTMDIMKQSRIHRVVIHDWVLQV